MGSEAQVSSPPRDQVLWEALCILLEEDFQMTEKRLSENLDSILEIQ